MSNVINLNKFRKQQSKKDAAKRADTNRRLHGRTKAERTREELQKKRIESVVDGASMREKNDEDA
jgi:hypothetical protein